MKLDIQTLAFIQCLTFVTQVIVLFVQYRVNRSYSEIKWWVTGSSLMALGVIFMPMVTIKSLLMLAMIANPLIVLGQIFLYVGITQFLHKKKNMGKLISIYTVFIFSYFYFMYVHNDISSRTVVIHTTLAIISIMTAYQLFFKKDRFISWSANFTATIFFSYGCFSIVRVLFALLLPPMHLYSDQATILQIGFVVPTIISSLWTFGFIIMLNQRLNIENLVEKEKMQQIFNTSPDATFITRLNDGLFMEVNDGFSEMTGYSHDEAIENSKVNANLWQSIEDREIFLKELNEKGNCKNMEFVFKRKDGSQFVGMVSARILIIYDVCHVISVIQDITQRKLAEDQIKQLVKQLETEKNIAQLNSVTDSLTGLANRRYFDEALRTEFYRLKRSGSNLSLIMLDIDYFKNFNDKYGHLAGDDCLRQMGTMLKTIVMRVPDIVARYGGEEFVVILPEIEGKGAEALAKRIQKAVEDLAIPHCESSIAAYVTVSIGVVTVSTKGLTSPEQILALADEAMYAAKKGGRNCIEVAIFRNLKDI